MLLPNFSVEFNAAGRSFGAGGGVNFYCDFARLLLKSEAKRAVVL